MVKELHNRGYEKLRVLPYLAPSGLSWRCEFTDGEKSTNCPASVWIGRFEDENTLSPQELADMYIKENAEYLENCKGENKEYVKWYSDMVDNLQEGELPYAFGDDYEPRPADTWETSLHNMIKTLPDENKYFDTL